MGYAVPGQRGSGIHQRLRARAFAFADGAKRNVYVSIDGGMGSDLVNMRVLDVLNERLGKDVYTIDVSNSLLGLLATNNYFSSGQGNLCVMQHHV